MNEFCVFVSTPIQKQNKHKKLNLGRVSFRVKHNGTKGNGRASETRFEPKQGERKSLLAV